MNPELGIGCPGCGRSYDAARFGGGRTLDCACGARVGRRMKTGVPGSAGPPRFLADVMLEGLARRLRALGYDAAWEPGIEDAELVRRGAEEGRWVLTRDRRLVREWWADHLLVLERDDPLEQLAELHARMALGAPSAFSRCTRCNVGLHPAPPERRAELPERIRTTGAAAAECPACRRLYWEGSHTARMRRALERALVGGAAPPLHPAGSSGDSAPTHPEGSHE